MEAVSPAGDLATCPTCGNANPVRFRLCGFCGTELATDRPSDEIRRYVTVVNSDLKGSTALGERLDPESLREVLTRYFDEMRRIFEGHGGTIEKIIGDAVVAVFGLPVRRDDDALRAVSAAAESMAVLAVLNDQLEALWGVRLVTRTGVSTGEVVVGDVSASQHVLTGDTMKVSSAMEQNAPPLEVLIAEPTYEIVRDVVEVEPMGPITPKGTALTTEAYRLISVREPLRSGAGTGVTTPGRGEARYCSNCGEENPDGPRLCGMCGSPLEKAATAQESRKTVTLVFADPKPRTQSGEPPSPEAMRDVMSSYFHEMKRALERHGGTVEKFIGDAVMAVYGLPVRHEDDAVRALRAALDMQAALPALNEEFAAKWGVHLLNAIGVNTGEVIAGDATHGQRLVTGDAVNVAARLEQAAGPAEVIIGDLTYRLAKDFAEVEAIPPLLLKGKAQPVPAYRLHAVRITAAEPAGSASPFVGREEEMDRLAVALGEAETGRVARMLTVVGDAGVGKSRLIKEFAIRAGEGARVLRGRCLPYGDGITFWPLAEAVREAAGIAADDTPDDAVARLAALLESEGSELSERREVLDRVAAAIGLSPAQFPIAELFWGARKLLEAIGMRRPLIVIVDDIHSAEQTFLDLLDHLIEAVSDGSLMLLCSARHELMERHADWAQGHSAELIVLKPLSDAESGMIVEELLGESGLDHSVVARITSAAEGNPLFVEQMVSMLVDTGAIRQEDGRWRATASGSQLAIPPSIHALLAARFDSLRLEEKQVLEPASVIGLSFPIPAVTELVDAGLQLGLQGRLEDLDRRQFVKPTTIDEDEAYRFAHILVRDTAYGSLLKRSRARYHEQFVDWAERVNAERGRAQEFEEIHGYHLEQAYRYRIELGLIDEAAREVGRRASNKLASAGRRAMGRGDMPAAVNLLRRATETREKRDPERLQLIPDLALALRELGEFAEAAARLDEVRSLATEAGDEVLAGRAILESRFVQGYTDPGQNWSTATSHDVDRLMPLFEKARDDAALTLAWRLRASIHGWESRWADLANDLSNAIDHARLSGDQRAESRASVGLARAALYGPTPVPEAIAQCEALVAAVSDDQIAVATINLQLAELYAMRGEFEHARELYRGARSTLEDLRAGIAASVSSVNSSHVEILAGDPAAAEMELRRDQLALTALEENYFRLTVEAQLARAVLAQDRPAEAEGILAGVRDGASADDIDAQALWRQVMARVLAVRGDPKRGVALAAEAVALRRESQDEIGLTEALGDLADVQLRSGDVAGADVAAREALDLARHKGDVVSARRLEAILADPILTA